LKLDQSVKLKLDSTVWPFNYRWF